MGEEPIEEVREEVREEVHEEVHEEEHEEVREMVGLDSQSNSISDLDYDMIPKLPIWPPTARFSPPLIVKVENVPPVSSEVVMDPPLTSRDEVFPRSPFLFYVFLERGCPRNHRYKSGYNLF